MKKIIIFLIVIIILALIWYLGSPLFIDKEVNEDFFIENIADEEVADINSALREFGMEELQKGEIKQMTKEEKNKLELEIIEKGAEMPKTIVSEEIKTDLDNYPPSLILSGDFRDADNFHRGSGIAKIYKLPDEKHVLRLEDFEVTNGPDLRVLLVKNSNPEKSSDVQAGYVELASLKGNIGNQNYEIPESLDFADYQSVVIYCKPFHVIFSVASLK